MRARNTNLILGLIVLLATSHAWAEDWAAVPTAIEVITPNIVGTIVLEEELVQGSYYDTLTLSIPPIQVHPDRRG